MAHSQPAQPASDERGLNFRIVVFESLEELRKEVGRELDVLGASATDPRVGFVAAAIEALRLADHLLRGAIRVQVSSGATEYEQAAALRGVFRIFHALPLHPRE